MIAEAVREWTTTITNEFLISFLLVRRYEPRYPGDTGEDSHGHGHGHADVHSEDELDDAAGPVNDFGVHEHNEDAHAGNRTIRHLIATKKKRHGRGAMAAMRWASPFPRVSSRARSIALGRHCVESLREWTQNVTFRPFGRRWGRRGEGAARKGAGALLGDDRAEESREKGQARQTDVGQTVQRPRLHELQSR